MNESSDYREISDPAVMAVQPLVSVHMLAYRHESFLAEAIKGVVAQVCDFPIELIIAEDCSPDKTLAIALDYQRRYPHLIRIITGDRNVGMHANSTRSMATIRGEYTAFCEGDDFWHYPGKLQMQVTAMLASPNTTLCHTDFDRQVRFGVKRNCHRATNLRDVADGSAYEMLLHHWSVMTATAMYRTNTLRAFSVSQFSVTSWPFGDYNLALFAAVQGRIAYLPVSTATWRKVAGSATNANVEAYLNMALAYSDCREIFLANYPVSDEVALSVRAESKRRIMDRAFWAGRLDLFDGCVAWLSEHHRKPNILFTQLKRLVLRTKWLSNSSRSFRTFVRHMRLIGR